MSRKRKLKKQRKRQQEWIEKLEELYLRQEDDAFLEAAWSHRRDLDASPVAGLYEEVVDRALAGALKAGDLARVGALLGRVRRGGGQRPTVLLAAAVDQLAKRCREEAVASLAALAETGAAVPGVDPRLPSMLLALAATDGEPVAPPAAGAAPAWREIEQMRRLSRALEAHAVSGGGLPRSPALDSPACRAVWGFYRALAAVAARDFRPGAKTLATLEKAVTAARSEAPADAAFERLLAETEKRLRALAALRELEQTLRRRRGALAEEVLLAGFAATGISARLLRDDPPALLRPLHHALRSRWRALLERVSERRGSAGLAALLAARPEIVAADLDSDTETARIKRWAGLAPLLESERFGELGAFLRAAGARTEAPQRLAALWSLELWAWREEHECAEEPAQSPADPHRRQLRLLEMAADLSRRFSAGERPEVARFLRDELLRLYDELYFCGHSLTAAQALMEHLGDDPGLLIVALAGAACAEDDRARRRLAARVAARGAVRADTGVLLRLLSTVVAEKAAVAAGVLTASRPLFDEAGWSEVLDRVTPEAAGVMRGGLSEAAEAAWENSADAEWILGEVRRDLELYRPLLGERPELAALDVAVACWDAEASDVKLHVRHFLRRFDGLEPALMLYRDTRQLSEAGVAPRVDAAVVETILDRLDSRWQLWAPYVVSLAADATAPQLKRLRRKILAVSQDRSLDDSERKFMRRLAKHVGKLRWLKAMPELEPADEPEADPRATARPKPAKPRRRRRKPVDDRQLDLFG